MARMVGMQIEREERDLDARAVLFRQARVALRGQHGELEAGLRGEARELAAALLIQMMGDEE